MAERALTCLTCPCHPSRAGQPRSQDPWSRGPIRWSAGERKPLAFLERHWRQESHLLWGSPPFLSSLQPSLSCCLHPPKPPGHTGLLCPGPRLQGKSTVLGSGVLLLASAKKWQVTMVTGALPDCPVGLSLIRGALCSSHSSPCPNMPLYSMLPVTHGCLLHGFPGHLPGVPQAPYLSSPTPPGPKAAELEPVL